MECFKLDIHEIKPVFVQDFTIIYKGNDGIIEIKTSKEAFLQKLRYFYQKRNELFIVNEYFIHDKYETDIFKCFIESIINPAININKINISKYYELSCKYEYLELKQQIEEFNQERPDLLEITDQLSDIKGQNNEDQYEITSNKEDIIAQNLDVCIRNGFLKKLSVLKLGRILNSPKRKIIDHHLLFDFVIDCIRNHSKYITKGEEENLAILTCSLDYNKMNDNEITELLSLEQNMSIFRPMNPEERMKSFIKESAQYQSKITELETMLKQLISKEEENEKKIYELEQKLISNEEENEKKLLELEQKLISNEEKNEKKISELEQKLISKEEESKENVSKLEQKLISNEEKNEKRISELEQKVFLNEEDMQIVFKKNDLTAFEHKYTEMNEINVRSTDKISNIIEKHFNFDFCLSYNGIILDPYLTLKDYDIQNKSIIYYFHKCSFIVFIKKNDYDYFPYAINLQCKVDDLMNEISLKFRINDYKLIYENKELKMGDDLQNYSISNKSIISISPPLNTIYINFHVNYLLYQPFSYMIVNQTDKINVIEEKLNEEHYLFSPDIEIIYFYKGEKLQTNKTFDDYFITNNSLIVLYLKSKFVKVEVLEDYLKIPENYSILDTKMKIQEKTGIPLNNQRLFIKQRELYDYDYISFYSFDFIRFFHFPEGSKLIYVEFDTNIGKVNDFIIYKDSLPIKTIWQKLHELTYLSYIDDMTSLALDGQYLDKNKTLENYKSDIEPGCKLSFSVNFFRSNRIHGSMTILIKSYTDKPIQIICEPTDTIEMIEYDLALLTEIHPIKLCFRGQNLMKGHKLQDYHISNLCIIQEVIKTRHRIRYLY